MSEIPKFNPVQKEFIHAALSAEAPIGKIVDDLMEIYPQFRAADSDIKSALTDRITKIKTRMPETEKKAQWEARPHYLSADWRLAYFRALLAETDDMSLKIRLLGEIRKEVETLDKQNKMGEHKRKEAYEARELEETLNDPHYIAYEHAVSKDWIFPGSILPIKAYEQINENEFRRKTDGVVVHPMGEPEKIGEKSHHTWMEEQEEQGTVYNYDPKDPANTIEIEKILKYRSQLKFTI